MGCGASNTQTVSKSPKMSSKLLGKSASPDKNTISPNKNDASNKNMN